ncbi:MAG TPA: ATP-dependent DNA ligase [Terriglobales bacterium]|jgi:DNA ligase-1|nr:ATP-dependent DNA ligase [Terriglobales bacterium]
MQSFSQTADSIAWTSKKLEKVSLLAEYLSAKPVTEAALAAIFFSGRPFPAYEETTLQAGGALLWRLAAEIAGVRENELSDVYRRHGDLGDAVEEVFNPRKSKTVTPEISVAELAESFRTIAAARGPAAKSAILRPLLERASAGGAKYIIKIILGDLRIGLKESLVEEAIAKAFGVNVKDVQRANMMLGDIGETLRLAAAHKLEEARMRLFHPIGFMLASPVESAEEAFEAYGSAVQFSVEDKYDGIRAQAHIGNKDGHRAVRIFSRTRDDVTESFPELVQPLASLQGELVLDGEIVAWEPLSDAAGRAMPFSELQKRLGRKKVAAALLTSVPVAYLAFDILYCEGELLIDRPLRERYGLLTSRLALTRNYEQLATIDPQGKLAFEPTVTDKDHKTEIIRAPFVPAASPEQLEELFLKARERGNEGLMLKDLQSAYTPGRRGRAWLKLKRELATLDVVVTAAEYGHGKRAGVLSDYTFAVRDEQDGNKLLNIGKAYSGLTDVEIAELTRWFLEHTIVDEGFRRQVEPKIVLEVAFNNMMKSDRHESGFALRFPRILRIRSDKLPEEIDTLAAAGEIFARQHERKN